MLIRKGLLVKQRDLGNMNDIKDTVIYLGLLRLLISTNTQQTGFVLVPNQSSIHQDLSQ